MRRSIVECVDVVGSHMVRVEGRKILETEVWAVGLGSKRPGVEGMKAVGRLAQRSISVMVKVKVECIWVVACMLFRVWRHESSQDVLDMPAIQGVAAVAAQAAVLAHLGIPAAAYILLLVVKLAPMASFALSYCQQVDLMAAEVQRTAAPVRHLESFVHQPLYEMSIEPAAIPAYLDPAACSEGSCCSLSVSSYSQQCRGWFSVESTLSLTRETNLHFPASQPCGLSILSR